MIHKKYRNAPVVFIRDFLLEYKIKGIVIGFCRDEFIIRITENSPIKIGAFFASSPTMLGQSLYDFNNTFAAAIFFDQPLVLIDAHYIWQQKKYIELIKHDKNEINKLIAALEL